MNLIYVIRKCPDYLKRFFKYERYIAFLEESTCLEIYRDITVFYKFLEYKFNIYYLSIDNINLDNILENNQNLYYDYILYLKNNLNNNKETIYKKVYSLKKLLKYLFENNLVSKDFEKQIEYRKEKKKRIIKHLNLEESKEYLKLSFENHNEKLPIWQRYRNYCICNLFLNLGIRVGELAKLRLNDIDFENKTILINGKGNKQRMLYLNNSAINALKSYLKVRPKLKENNLDFNFLFISSRKTKLSKREVQYITKELFKKIDKKEFSVHKLRSTFVNILYDNLILENIKPQLLVFSNILGHNSLKTLNRYLSFNKENLKEKVNNFDIFKIAKNKRKENIILCT